MIWETTEHLPIPSKTQGEKSRFKCGSFSLLVLRQAVSQWVCLICYQAHASIMLSAAACMTYQSPSCLIDPSPIFILRTWKVVCFKNGTKLLKDNRGKESRQPLKGWNCDQRRNSFSIVPRQPWTCPVGPSQHIRWEFSLWLRIPY